MPEPTTVLELGENGVNPDRHATWREERSLRTRGRWVQIRVRNEEGRMRITALQVEATTGTRTGTDKR